MNLDQGQLFIDDELIEEGLRLGRCIHQPQKFPEPVLRPEKPWERNAVLLWGSVIWDERERIFKMWYQTFAKLPPPEATYVCYATSADGLNWEGPVIGDIEYRGSKENNIVLDSKQKLDSPTVLFDPRDSGERRYKMLFYEPGTDEGHPRGLYAAFSPDGLHWKRLEKPVAPTVGDRTNVMFDPESGKYVAYTRHREMMQRYRARCIYRSESDDFINWTEPEIVLFPDLVDGPDIQFYSMVAFRYESIYLGLIEYMQSTPDVLDMRLAVSRDNRKWSRVEPRDAFLSRGPEGSWQSAWVNISANPPIRVGDRLWWYFSGRNSAHGQQWPHPYAAIGVASSRPDGMASIEAGPTEGRLLTKPLLWPGGRLEVNASTHQSPHISAGVIRVEVQDERGVPIPGYSREEAAPLVGDNLAFVPAWRSGRDTSQLAGKRLRMAFCLQSARLFSFRPSATLKGPTSGRP